MQHTDKIFQYVLEIYDSTHRRKIRVIVMFGCRAMNVEFVSRNIVTMIESAIKFEIISLLERFSSSNT